MTDGEAGAFFASYDDLVGFDQLADVFETYWGFVEFYFVMLG